MKKVLTFIIILLLIFAFVCGYNYVNEPKEHETKIIEKINNINEKESGYLYVYMDKDENLCNFNMKCDIPAYKIKTTKPNSYVAKVSDYNNFLLIEDDGLKIVDLQNEKIKEISLNNVYDSYKLHTKETNKKEELLGISCYIEKEGSTQIVEGYYNYKLDKKLYETETFEDLTVIDDNYAYASSDTKNEDYLLDVNDEVKTFTFNRIVNSVVDINKTTMEVYYIKERTIIKVNSFINNELININLYSLNGKEIATNLSDVSIKDNKIYTLKNNEVTIYNSNLEVEKIINMSDYTNYMLINNFLVSYKEDTLYLIDLIEENAHKLISDLKDFEIERKYSGYLSGGIFKNLKDTKGIYIVLKKDNNYLEIYYDSELQKVESHNVKIK